MNLPIYILGFLIAMSLAGFLLCGLDKRRAKRRRQRIPEAALLLVGLCGGGIGLLAGMLLFRHKTRKLKFRLLAPLECLLCAVVLIHTVSALTLDRRVQYLEVSYASPALPPELDGYLLAFVTDTHSMSAEELRKVAERINGFAPDLLLLGGDFPAAGDAPARSMEILSGVDAADGVYGVEGNHDDHRALFAAMERFGITPLSNSAARPRAGLYLAGVEDLWNRQPDIAEAIQDAGAEDFVLLLAHNPDVTMQQDTTGVHLTLSGHTHGGQITLFGVFAPALSLRTTITDYGQRFQSGWAKSRDGSDVFVSNGTGYITLVPRVFARPQVILLTLRQEAATAAH